MKSDIDISVIMLTYNREKYIERAIKSVLSQTIDNFEFIIINNGSTDDSGLIAEKYAKEDSRIQVQHKQKGSIGSGRNAGLDISVGNFITFFDDDDYAEIDYLEFLYNLIKFHDADIAVCGSNIEVEGNLLNNGEYVYNEIYEMNEVEATECYLNRARYNAAMPTKLIKRYLFDQIRFPDVGSYDDITTTYKYFANAKKVVAHGVPKYTFYRHSGNNSSSATKHHLLNEQQLKEYLKAFRERTEYISDLVPELTDLALYSEWSYMISMIEKINRFELEHCDALKNQMIVELSQHQEEFLNSVNIKQFEREWMERFVIE